LFDTEGAGVIDIKELSVSVRALGFDIDKMNVKKMIDKLIKRGENNVMFDDFLNAIS